MCHMTILLAHCSLRLSGVSMSMTQVVEKQLGSIPLYTVGYGMPAHFPKAPWRVLSPFYPSPRVFHARRNNELLLGVILKKLARSPVKLVFTSSSPRKRSTWTQWLLRQTDAIVATHPKNATVMPTACTLIPHGIDTKKFHPNETDPPSHIGCFGRIRPQKGCETFVRALCQVLPKYPQVTASLVGRVQKKHLPFATKLRQIIAEHHLQDRITLQNEVPLQDMAPCYRQLSVYVCPSFYEGFGLTPLEAMASGLPVIASRDVGTFNELIEDGKQGYLVSAGDHIALAERLDQLLSKKALRKQMGEQARQKILSHYPLTKEAQALITLYQRLLATENKST